MALFICDGCSRSIPKHGARIHCQLCNNFDLCANCFVIGKIPGSHTTYHPTILFRTSGSADQVPTAGTAQSQPTTTASISPQLTTTTLTDSHPTPGQTCQAPSMLPPVHPVNQTSLPSYEVADNPTPIFQPTTLMPFQTSSKSWVPFFNSSNWTPTACFTTLCEQIFRHLDLTGSGVITPEMYSSLLENGGYPIGSNAWEHTRSEGLTSNARDHAADAALRGEFDIFSIEYKLKDRPLDPVEPVDTSLQAGEKTILKGSMPCLTLKGFMDLHVIFSLHEPSNAHACIALVIRLYRLPMYLERGDLPRRCLPSVAPPDVRAKIDNILQQAAIQAFALARLHSQQHQQTPKSSSSINRVRNCQPG